MLQWIVLLVIDVSITLLVVLDVILILASLELHTRSICFVLLALSSRHHFELPLLQLLLPLLVLGKCFGARDDSGVAKHLGHGFSTLLTLGNEVNLHLSFDLLYLPSEHRFLLAGLLR